MSAGDMERTYMIERARGACDAWRDATDLVRMHFDVPWEIEYVTDARWRLWGVVGGAVYIAARLWTRAEGLARAGMAERGGMTLLRSTDGGAVTALSTALRDDGRIAQRLDADELHLDIERATGAGEDPDAYEVP